MFERFTDRARRVVVLAQEEARMLNHNYIGTEHIVLGLLHEGEGVGASALMGFGVTLERFHLQVEEIIGQGEEEPSGHIPFTPRARKVLELSLREALQLGHEYIGTEHILLGVIREGEGVAAQILVKLGVGLNPLRQRVIQLLKSAPAPPAVPAPPAPTGYDDQIAQVRRDKESAIDAQDFERAAALRDTEKSLLAQQAQARAAPIVPGRVFICYRRDDSAWVAGRVHDELVRQLGPGLVFMDVDSIEPGRDFVEATMAAISSCDFVLVLIGPTWLTATTSDGLRRLDVPGDYVRTELETALSLDKRIVPALIEGALMPRADQLPASVAGLARRNAIKLDHTGFHDHMRNLIRVIAPSA